MRATAEIKINSPIDEVWGFVSNVENMGRWVEGIEDPTRTSDGDLGVGSTFHSKYNYRGKSFDMDHEVDSFDPPTSFGTRSIEGPFAYEGTLLLAESEGGTTVSNTIEVGSDSWMTTVMFAVFGPLTRRMMRGQLMKELKALEKELEAGVG